MVTPSQTLSKCWLNWKRSCATNRECYFRNSMIIFISDKNTVHSSTNSSRRKIIWFKHDIFSRMFVYFLLSYQCCYWCFSHTILQYILLSDRKIMSTRDTCGFILSIFVTGATLWACTFKVEHVVMGELATAPGGKYNFLTILNLVSRSCGLIIQQGKTAFLASTVTLFWCMHPEFLPWYKYSCIRKTISFTEITRFSLCGSSFSNRNGRTSDAC